MPDFTQAMEQLWSLGPVASVVASDVVSLGIEKKKLKLEALEKARKTTKE
jgi:hypothetical protein